MGLHDRSPPVQSILLLWFLFGSLRNHITAQRSNSLSIGPARALDALLQDYAFRAFVRPRTGIPYEATVPSNLTGVELSAMRLRAGSLRARGVQSYKEFEIPTGVDTNPYVERIVLVYQNLGNWSTEYYPLPDYTYLTPVLGLLAYDAVNLMARNLPELNISATSKPILVHFGEVKSTPAGSSPKCVQISLDGSVNLSSPISGTTCSTVDQGHFAIVVESIAPSPGGGKAPVVPINAEPPSTKKGKKGNESSFWIIAGSVLGGLAMIGLLGLVIVWAQKSKQRKKLQQMERAAEVGEDLHMASAGPTKAPAAMVTRTQPFLETEYVP